MTSLNVESNKDRRVTNIDLRKYWNDITIDGCNLINTTYASAGGTIWIRAGEEGTGNLVMKNNYIKKSCHDETIAIFGSGVVNDVLIENNTIDFDDTNVDIPSNPVINFGLDTTKIKNIRFTNNNVKVIANGTCMVFNNAENVLVNDCTFDILFTSDKDYLQYFVSYGNTTDIKFDNNEIEFKGSCDTAEIFYDIDTITNNTMNVKTPFSEIAQNCSTFSNNVINLFFDLNEHSSIIRFRDLTFNRNTLISKNKINYNVPITNSTRFVNFHKSCINEQKVEISENEIIGVEGQETDKQYAIYFQEMKDTNPQKIYLLNNNLGFYSNKIDQYQNLVTYEVVTE